MKLFVSWEFNTFWLYYEMPMWTKMKHHQKVHSSPTPNGCHRPQHTVTHTPRDAQTLPLTQIFFLCYVYEFCFRGKRRDGKLLPSKNFQDLFLPILSFSSKIKLTNRGGGKGHFSDNQGNEIYA